MEAPSEVPDPSWWISLPEDYEVLEEMVGLPGYEDEKLYASYTPSNGIRLGILNQDDDGTWDDFWREFNLTPERSIALGETLIRWGRARGSVY